METKTLNQKKKELFELLVEYYSLKPEDKWCMKITHKTNGVSCAIGHLDRDFGGLHNKVIQTVRHISGPGVLHSGLIEANDNNLIRYQHLSTPKERVIAYLEDEIKKLS